MKKINKLFQGVLLLCFLSGGGGEAFAGDLRVFPLTLSRLARQTNGPVVPPDISMNEIMLPSFDGVKLRTLVFQKKGVTSRQPVVVQRSPYFLVNGQFWMIWPGTAKYYVDRGYIYVLQAVRGTGGSQGTYHIFSPIEARDGYQTVKWIGGQSFCNGNIGATGTSYDGFTALATGVYNPPGLKVIIAGGAPTTLNQDAFFSGGVMGLSILDYLRYNETGGSGPIYSSDFNEQVLQKLVNEPDLRKYDQIIFGRTLPDWQVIAENYPNPASPFWATRQIRTGLGGISVPTYHVAGMRNDGDMPDTVRNFIAASRGPHGERHHLILGYWDHGNSTPYVDGSALSPFMKERFDPLLAYYLKGTPTKYVQEPHVLMASNLGPAFIGSETYPPAMLKKVRLYLNRSGTGLSLNPSPPPEGSLPESVYLSIPQKLNTSLGEQTLRFSAKAPQSLPVLGEMDFDLYLKFDVPQTDISVGPIVIDPSGKGLFITGCATSQRVNFKSGITHLLMQTCPMMGVIPQGSTFGIDIATNVFPGMVRNTNNDVSGFYSKFSTAKITILHSKEYPSSVTMSIQ